MVHRFGVGLGLLPALDNETKSAVLSHCMVVLLHRVASDTVEGRVIDAAEECVGRFGWAKTTVADIASKAEMSRATLYRAFPGGRDAIFESVRRAYILSFFQDLTGPLKRGESLGEVLADAMVSAARALRDDERFQYQLAHEPGPLLQQLTFDGLDQILAASRVFVAPYLARFVSKRQANRLAEWATRIVLTYTLEPSPYFDPTDTAAVHDFVDKRVST